jgi:hypothetical protein
MAAPGRGIYRPGMTDPIARCGRAASHDGALDAIRRTMAYVAACAANGEAFSRGPIAVLRVAAEGLAPEDIHRAERALLEVLEVARLDRASSAQTLLGIAASVIRAGWLLSPDTTSLPQRENPGRAARTGGCAARARRRRRG